MQIITEINKLKKEKDFFVVAIDGRCGAGKSTLSDKLKQLYDFDVIHLDDFFLPFNLRTNKRLDEVGGNVHYERFFEQVVTKIKEREPFSYQRFDCQTGGFTDKINISCKKLIIVEGVYSMREEFRDVYDLSIFLEIDNNLQEQRIINRNGVEKFEMFKNIWIPMEEKYFEMFKIKGKCNLVCTYTDNIII